MAEEPTPGPQADKPIEEQAREQTGQQQVQLRIDESTLQSTYANAFRTNGTAEEVILDFGLNLVAPPVQQGQPQILFKVNQRVIMNYYSVKRLAITLSQLIRRHEEQFGEMELDVSKRRKAGGS
ncbi:MAG TPA: DUF3467 domain-containing protein [Phycisphaerae bacterium]|nr:DUF3467 domain-containing protein [Phycisphaerae bacterium]